MNWNRVSSIAEILSSIAILVTLGYLAVEIEQNAAATRADVQQAMLASDQQFLELMIDDPTLHLIWYHEELSEADAVRLNYLLISHIRMRENNWIQYRNGILDEETWHTYRRSLVVMLSAPRTREWWLEFGVERIFDPSFTAEVNALIQDEPILERSRHVALFDD